MRAATPANIVLVDAPIGATRPHGADPAPQIESSLFYEGDRRLGELDILAIADGRVIVGEAKKGDRLGDTARAERQAAARLLKLAEALTADTLVLARRAAWSQRTRDVIAAAVGLRDIETRLLETIGA